MKGLQPQKVEGTSNNLFERLVVVDLRPYSKGAHIKGQVCVTLVERLASKWIQVLMLRTDAI